MFLRCLVVAVAAAVSLSLCGAIAPERICGPFPILSVPYCEDGSLDTDTLLKEAEFVADCGVNGFIWAQSNDAIDLLTVDERKASFMALAKAFEGHDTIVALGCQGRNTADMEELARHVESLAAKHPSANLAIVSRPPHDARTQDDIERYYRALAKIAKRPVIIQTYTSDKVPVPDSSLLIRLAREYPSVYGWIKEETGGADANARMVAETSAPEIKTVFSAWGSYGWLDQFRRFGTRGVISERAGYADVMMNIWRALERGDSSQADSAFAQCLFMMNLKETVPGGHLRGFNLYILKKRGIFKNFVSREYADEDKTPGRWKLETRVFSPDEAAEIDRRFECLKPFFDTPKETKVYVRSVKIEDGENWWGAANFFGTNMPFTAKTDLKIDLRRRNYSNQCASLLVSDRGRAIWSDAQSEITFKNGTLTIDADSPVFVETATEPTLRGAYLHAMRKWFPPSGKSPDASFFTAPQLNTWIELTYHQNQKDVLSYARSMLEHGVPPGVLMIDDTWQAGYGDWRFEPSRFPDPKGMIDELHAMAYKVMLWMCPYVGMDLPAFRRIAWGQNPDDVHGYPVRGGFLADVSDAVPGEGEYDFKDKPKACGWWNGYSAFLDFSHPNANAWFTETLDGLVKDYGVDGFKFDGADLGAYNLSDRRAHDPKATSGSLNNGYCAYALRYPFCEIRNTWRMQQAPVVVRLHDKMHEWSALNRIVADMIAAGLIGQPFICPDMVGGGDWMAFIPGSPFEQELFIRSAEIHALCPMMQISASPWRVLDERHQAIFSEILALRQKFAPMIAALAKKAGEDGEPILRSLEYVYPGQGYAVVIDEFMMGEDLLVAPVLTKGANSREVVLPPGRWRDASGVIHAGPVRIMVDAPLGHLPHFVRVTGSCANGAERMLGHE
ncbi:MAG: dihydrodipicolinate synthase family protein [Kiritimatiellae bacterium]|nr:dihydrodipicolinate synthase family protein [Kiritimatiellia bacterium]